MIYTYGKIDVYEVELDLADNPEGRGYSGPVKKIGRRKYENGDVYPGGAAFQTAQDAADFLDNHNGIPALEFRVYGVLADWDTDTVQLEGEDHRRLINDAELVRVPSTEYW